MANCHLIIWVTLLTGFYSFRLDPQSMTQLATHGVFEVPGEVVPTTIWIQNAVLREELGRDFRQWICNPSNKSEICLTDDMIFVRAPHIKTPLNRRKRFLGSLLAGLLGIGGYLEAQSAKAEFRSKITSLVKDLNSLESGVQKIGREFVNYVKIDKEWKKDLSDYIHDEFGKQQEYNQEVMIQIKALFQNEKEITNEISKAIQNVRRDILNLAKLTSLSITRLADELSVLNTLVDAMLWESLRKGTFPEWALSLTGVEAAFKNLSYQITGFDSDEGWEVFKQIVLAAQWVPLISTTDGILLATLFPIRKNVGVYSQLTIPDVCLLADDGHYYTQRVLSNPLKIHYDDKVYYKTDQFFERCDSHNGISLCRHPATVATERVDQACSSSAFKGQPMLSCRVQMTECPNKYIIQSVPGSMIISGEFSLMRNDVHSPVSHSTALIIPLASSDSLVFYSSTGVPILTVRPSISSHYVPPSVIPLLGDWSFSSDDDISDHLHQLDVLKLPDFTDPPDFDEGEVMIRTMDVLEQVHKTHVTAVNEINNYSILTSTPFIIMMVIVGILVLAMVVGCVFLFKYRGMLTALLMTQGNGMPMTKM